MPQISIIMPVYNGELYLEKSLNSIKNQTFSDFEFLIIDDGSTDRTPEILKKYASCDSRIRILNQNHQGIVKALNLGIEESRGLFIARMDADDIALPDRLEKQYNKINSSPDIVALGTSITMIDPGSRKLRNCFSATENQEIVELLIRGKGSAIVHPTALFRKDALQKIGGYREKYKHVEDLDLYIRLSEVGQLANLGEILLHYRLHEQSANLIRINEQSALTKELLIEIYNKRGISLDKLNENLNFSRPSSRAEIFGVWSGQAFAGGYWQTGFYYAFRFLFCPPFNWTKTKKFIQIIKSGLHSK